MFFLRRAPQWASLLAVLIGVSVGGLCRGENTLPNGSFEEGQYPFPMPWKYGIWTGKAIFRISEEGRDGGRCGKVMSRKDGVDGGWCATVSVEPHTTYRLSGWIKTENVKTGSGRGAFFNVHGMEGVRTRALKGTTDWTYLEVYFNTIASAEVTINCMLGGWGTSEGTAWFDDVRLEVVRSKEDAISVQLDLSKTGHPISPYVYGQLIEHVGKCVYGGMWAEMLEDRKFFFHITDEFSGWIPNGEKSFTEDALYTFLESSPWRVIGPAGTVKMVQEGAFVGAHSPRITVQGDGHDYGISQERLGLVPDKCYTGRIVLSGKPSAAPLYINLIWGEGAGQRDTVVVNQLDEFFTKLPLSFTAGSDAVAGRLEIISRGCGTFRIGCVSLMPADHLNGWRSDVIGLLRELNATIYKWPGGNFVSGYDWRDGIGPRDRRDPMKNPHWNGVEDNDVGVHEFMHLCQLLGAEPSLAVSSGAGDAQQAAELVEYVNGPPDSVMGRKRVQNGHMEPYDVRLFYVGNEMWGNHQVGYIPIDLYTKKHNQMVKAMKAVDSSIQVVAVGRVGKWGERMLNVCADNMDFISENFYRKGDSHLWNHASSMSAVVRFIVDKHREYRRELPSLANKNLPLVIDEWGYWYTPKRYGQLGVQYYLEDALGIAAGMHEMLRNSDLIEIVHYAQAVNVLGAIKTSKTGAVFDTPGLVLKLYRNHMGTIPLEVQGVAEPLDIFASLSEDQKEIIVSVVNATEYEQQLNLNIDKGEIEGAGESFVITGKNRKAFNQPGKKENIKIVTQSRATLPERIHVSPVSIILLKYPIRLRSSDIP